MKNPLIPQLGLCLLSGLLLILSFPRANIHIFGWIGLIPWLIACDEQRPLRSFLLSYVTGVIFFAGTVYWFIHVTLLGLILLVLYLAVYFALFGLGYSFFRKESLMTKLCVLPSLWVALEFARANLLTGFGWASLAHAQYNNTLLIQIADVTGVYGISFLVVMTNVFLKNLWGYKKGKKEEISKAQISLGFYFVVGTLGLSALYGLYRIRTLDDQSYAMKVAIVQANTAQADKWTAYKWPSIMKKYLHLTRQAAGQKPDLIIWPETSFPGYIWEEPKRYEELKGFIKEIKTPLLLGTVIRRGEDYLNSALLYSREGKVFLRHDKLHLVPFGEYVPLRGVFPFLGDLIGIGDFTPGNMYTLFPSHLKDGVPVGNYAYSVLICFEDTIPQISREFVKRGASLLINITNDAWFLDTIAPFLHMQAAMFRAVENRRPFIRVANTGVSCFINEKGQILEILKDSKGKEIYVEGVLTRKIFLSHTKALYTKIGDIFTYLCFGCILWTAVRRLGRLKLSVFP